MTAIVFDLDGTLIDSVPDLHAAANRMLKAEGCPPLDQAAIRAFVGNGVPHLVRLILQASGIDMREHARLVSVFLAIYQADPCTLSTLYPGVRTCLDQLHAAGHTLGICTNKPEAPTEAILAGFGLRHLFSVVIGGDTLPVRKPDPAPLTAAFSALEPGPRLFVGDSEVDAETAQAQGAPFALFTEGYRKAPAAQLPHDVLFSTYEDLIDLAQKPLLSTRA
ncbi:phosphoglycolate phosphatase [Pseudoruegeria sp. SK021]|uniref:phosphoglycolate phosphatase n=1 Tax=Pseudoruegeria sp. SK021 TaxID=1933035 RepID=UPI000A248EE7|nr:phosphoglycolate phosphatase [Pseudoruegeria sp. SK021]OSP56296.1 phosphoglycolate phosphatase [Pseudoruegeria sp. SK021]